MTKNDKHTKEAGLKESLKRANRDLAVLYEVSKAMRTTLELDHILHIILTGVTSHTGLGFNRGILFLINQKERCLEPKMAIGPESGEKAREIWGFIENARQDLDDLIAQDKLKSSHVESPLFEKIKELKVPLDTREDNLLSKAFHSGTPMHVPPEHMYKYKEDPVVRTIQSPELVIMPLKAKDTVNGLIVADNLFTQKPITLDDLKIFLMLANQAGLAIENSQLYELVKHKSHTDALTNLWNHGYFQRRLSDYMDVAKEKKLAFSLVIMDIDDFKKLNDTYGHQCGDYVLREIAKILIASSRDKDIVCRYGGEEFALILTDTDRPQAYLIAERIRQNIAEHQLDFNGSGKTFNTTVSVGVSEYPMDAQTKEELISQADKAMYIAKFGGKNQTCFPQH